MSATCLEQLRYLDQRLQESELTPEENDLVRQHRLQALDLRQKRFATLGPMPTTHPDTWGWEKQKQEVENEIKLALETMLLSVPGLEAAWQKHTEIEKLKTLRADILQNASTLLAQQPAGGAASSTTTSQAPAQAAWDFAIPQIHSSWNPTAQLHQHQIQQQQQQQIQEEQAAKATQGYNDGPLAAQSQAAAAQAAAAQSAAAVASGVAIKLCRRCNHQKPVSEFYRSKANADGYDGRCKACDAIQCAERRRKKPRVDEPTVAGKECRRCNQFKGATEFYRNKTNPDGLYNNCKACFAADAVNRRQRMAPLEERTVAAKVCKRCQQTKSSSEFYRNKLMSDGLYSHCKTCYSQAAEERSAGRVPAESKECRRCHETKGKADFYHSKMTADGLQSYCKACYSVAAAQRRSRVSDGSAASPGEGDGHALHLDPGGVQVYGVLDQPDMQGGVHGMGPGGEDLGGEELHHLSAEQLAEHQLAMQQQLAAQQAAHDAAQQAAQAHYVQAHLAPEHLGALGQEEAAALAGLQGPHQGHLAEHHHHHQALPQDIALSLQQGHGAEG